MTKIVTPIKNEEQYQFYLDELKIVFQAKNGTPEGDYAEMLMLVIEKYEDEQYPIDPSDPIEAIKFSMEQQGLSQKDLVRLIGYQGRVSDILNRKRKLTLPMIRKISKSLHIDAGTLVQDYKLAT